MYLRSESRPSFPLISYDNLSTAKLQFLQVGAGPLPYQPLPLRGPHLIKTPTKLKFGLSVCSHDVTAAMLQE